MKTVLVYRQGDVSMLPVKSAPIEGKAPDLSRVNGERLEVEYGEVTGHCHALPAQCANRYIVGSEGKEYIEVIKPCEMTHEEHSPIKLPEGLYEGRRCQEYTPEGARRVLD